MLSRRAIYMRASGCAPCRPFVGGVRGKNLVGVRHVSRVAQPVGEERPGAQRRNRGQVRPVNEHVLVDSRRHGRAPGPLFIDREAQCNVVGAALHPAQYHLAIRTGDKARTVSRRATWDRNRDWNVEDGQGLFGARDKHGSEDWKEDAAGISHAGIMQIIGVDCLQSRCILRRLQSTPGLGGRVVMQRTATPRTPVRFRP